MSLTLALDYRVSGGLNPVPFHVTQLLLFALVGVALAHFYRTLFDSTGQALWHRWAALFAATLFCVHTANSQAGNYISARSELLAALGVLTAFLAYLYAPRSRRYHLYLLPLILGALAKNHAVTFAPLLLLYKLLIEEQCSARQVLTPREWPRLRSALLSSLPAFLVSAILFTFIESMAPAGQSYGGGGRLRYLATQAWVWVRYVGMYLVPAGLTADTDLRPFTSMADPRTYAGLGLLAASLVAAWRASRTRLWRPAAYGIAWFWITIAPTSSVVPLAEVTNDHRPFLAFMGLNAAVVWATWLLIDRLRQAAPARWHVLRATAVIVALLLLGAHGIATFRRNTVWRSDETLWADVARKSPGNGRGLMNYGLAKMRRGQLADARDLFLRAQRLTPNYSFLETNLGIVTNALGDARTAERHFLRAAALDASQPTVHLFYARFLIASGRAPEAIAPLQRSMALSPGRVEPRHLLMALYAAWGAEPELRALANETLRLVRSDSVALAHARGDVPLVPTRDDYDGWFALGWSHTGAERHLEAAQAYRAALKRNASNADAWNNLGWTLGKLGFFDAAVAPLQQAVALRPDYQLARNNLAWVRSEAANRRSQ
ncbi:MAG: tetratricopeptide repeat protein [Gemmatimonadaceae bacterium]